MADRPRLGIYLTLTPLLASAAPSRSSESGRARPLPDRWLVASGGPDDTVHVGRRRPSGPDTSPRERADAPERRRDDGGSSTGGGGGGGNLSGSGGGGLSSSGGGGASGGLPGGSSGLIGLFISLLTGRFGCWGTGIAIVAIVAIVAFVLFSGGGGSPQPTEVPPAEVAFATELPIDSATASPTETPIPTRLAPSSVAQATVSPKSTISSESTVAPSAAAPTAPSQSAGAGARPGQKWTVMLYQAADDKVLAADIFFDLNEAERVGSSDRVNIIAQIDRYRRVPQGTDTWVGAKRFYVKRDNDLNHINSQELANLGQIDMSNPQTLVNFATWAIKAYPADKYVLIMSDHGMGWPGGFTDATAVRRALPNAPLASAAGSQIYLNELDNALGQIRQQTGVNGFELIGLDACLMSQLEVYTMLAPHARYAVASEETEPALGFAYTAFLSKLESNPDVTGADLGRAIVQSYIRQDERIVDDQARLEYMRQGSPMGGFFQSVGSPSADQLAQEMGDSITLAALDLGALPALQQSVNDFALALQGAPQAAIDKARTYAQSFTSIFGEQIQPSYIDLGHFSALAARAANNADVTRTAAAVQAAIKRAVLAEKHGPKKPGATGIAIYFPNSQLYRSPEAGPASYSVIAGRFAGSSLWGDYLTFHYTGRRFSTTDRAPSAPSRLPPVKAPGAGQIQVSPVRLSANTVSIRQTINMQADVSGTNVGYVYFFTGFYDRKNSSINVADTDYLASPQSLSLDGVYYPDWGAAGRFTLDFDWEPLMFSISDGKTSAQVLLRPRSYGAASEQAVYIVDGIYNFADGSEARSAQLFFSNGLLRQVVAFGSVQQNGTGAAAVITPHSGDSFTVLEQWLDLDANGQVSQTATQQGKTLTFGGQAFTWKQLDAAAGEYVIGFIVEDLDGNRTQSFASVRVR